MLEPLTGHGRAKCKSVPIELYVHEAIIALLR